MTVSTYVVSPRNIRLQGIGDEGSSTRGHTTNGRDLRIERSGRSIATLNRRSGSRSRSGRTAIVETRNEEHTAFAGTHVGILHDPRGSVLHTEIVSDCDEVATLRRTGESSSATRIDEGLRRREIQAFSVSSVSRICPACEGEEDGSRPQGGFVDIGSVQNLPKDVNPYHRTAARG